MVGYAAMLLLGEGANLAALLYHFRSTGPYPS